MIEDPLSRLTPSARAVFDYLVALETGHAPDLFQDSDDETRWIKRVTETFRGSIVSALLARLSQVLRLGNVTVITQRDMMSLIESMWSRNISCLSENETKVIRYALEVEGASISELASKSGLSYPKVRRAYQQLTQRGVLRVEGMPTLESFGLERLLVIFERPTLVFTSPFIEHAIFIDSPVPYAIFTVIYPKKRREDIFHLVHSLRGTSDSVTLWTLSRGQIQFSPLYFDRENCNWSPDLFHFRLMLRAGGEPPVLGSIGVSTVVPRTFKDSELITIDRLRMDFEQPVSRIAQSTGLSESTVFRIRQTLRNEAVIVPRVRIHIPALDGRVMMLLSAEAAGNVLPAWNCLPLTYISRVNNIEDSSQSKILLIAALPRGACLGIVNVIRSEMSRVDEYSVYEIAAGYEYRTPLTTISGRHANGSNAAPHNFFDARSYDSVRRGAEDSKLPLDLA